MLKETNYVLVNTFLHKYFFIDGVYYNIFNINKKKNYIKVTG